MLLDQGVHSGPIFCMESAFLCVLSDKLGPRGLDLMRLQGKMLSDTWIYKIALDSISSA